MEFLHNQLIYDQITHSSYAGQPIYDEYSCDEERNSESIYIEFFNNQPVYASSKSDDEKLPNQSVIFSSSSNVNQ